MSSVSIVIPPSSPKINNKPQNNCQNNGNYYTAYYRKIEPPVLRAELQITRQLKQPNPTQQNYQHPHRCYNNPHHN